ncbi:MAG TPA: serine/threonine-protein kinase, partial [Polyangiales bacterium]|nr:serine/threonine-protein kinase [Polyangiales bacterium]
MEQAGQEASAVGSVGGRYRIETLLGQGGMAEVYQVVDTSTGERRALKRLIRIDDPRKLQRATELFEREFHTLSQLAHPRVVSVFDYGVEDGTPYYTMELLDGGDLQQRAPVSWQVACKLARDVCSALSVLHSRRMVYRDLSPRNVRCTSDGEAKLIDFGAMAPMGASKQVVGTAAFCAPELVHLQAIDARTDLYSLGATLYFTLVGRRAYPARDFRQLRDMWRSTPRRLTELLPEIPLALERLVMELMQLDPSLRPASAAEVMDRLSAIAELPADEQMLVSQAYLTTPTLVARDRELARVRRKMLRALRGRGGAVLISGGPGVGRSRLLDACVLEAKLAGSTVMRADAADAHAGDYGVVRAIANQLIEALPEMAIEAALPRLPILGHVLPELIERFPHVALELYPDAQQARPAVQTALREWLWEVSRKRS